jgi:rubrerythrin
MKGISIITAILFLVSMLILPSCNSSAPAQDEMMKPVSANQETTSGNASAEEQDDDQAGKDANQGNAYSGGKGSAVSLNMENMQEAYKGETTASAKYADYSKKAELEGYHQIAMLFKAASVSEKAHANNHRAVLEEAGQVVPQITPSFKVLTTQENLKDAIAGETYEITTMYPQFLTNANAVGNQFSLISLNYAYKTEQKHKPLYEKALAALGTNTEKSLPSVYYVCPTCGNTYETTPPKRCGISMTGAEKFLKISSLNS